MVGRDPLEVDILVRIQVPQQYKRPPSGVLLYCEGTSALQRFRQGLEELGDVLSAKPPRCTVPVGEK